ncbi:hypothetical protein B484DRAFT_428226 [Ochromonadaceae sp. CCMP2298]|nr:hypothetical protein B484DRAFT_428226 [Ochromonadaceae sp. CCMP2298]
MTHSGSLSLLNSNVFVPNMAATAPLKAPEWKARLQSSTPILSFNISAISVDAGRDGQAGAEKAVDSLQNTDDQQLESTTLGRSSSSIEEKLDAHLLRVVGIKKTKAALYADATTYKASLPVREDGAKGTVLYKQPFWVHYEDLKAYVEALEKPKGPDIRAQVKYACAPTKSGKSSSVLPAFLKSAEGVQGFTHYLHLPFHNNGGRCFKVVGKLEKKTAELAGAAFILDALTMLLDNDDAADGVPLRVPDVNKLKEVADELRKKLEDQLGDDCKPLIHLDEHRRMTGKSLDDLTSVDRVFRMGALHCLGYLGDSIGLIATYTDRLIEFAVEGSSEACRVPVALPCADPSAMMRDVPELHFSHPPDLSDFVEKRLWATLLFRLMIKVQKEVELGGLHRRSAGADSFLRGFQTKANGFSIVDKNARRKALGDCIEFVTLSENIEVSDVHSANACQLLLGVADVDTKAWKRQESELVVLPNRRLSVSLQRLLKIYDEKVPVYRKGAEFFHDKAFCATGDFLSSTPLEAAYVWTLAVHLAKFKSIKFLFDSFDVEKLVKIKSGRLFPGNQVDKPDIDAITALRKDALYYAAEKDGLHATHSRADIWFRTTDEEVVLIDVFGGQNAEKLANKVQNLQDLIDDWNNKTEFKGLRTFVGVVLAPSIPDPSARKTLDKVQQVVGSDARELLGGLDQVFRWFDNNNND